MRTPRPALAWSIGLLVTVVAAVIVGGAVDTEALGTAARAMAARPLEVAAVLAVYASAFALRAVAWRRVLPRLPFGQSLAALHVALAGNHVLPFRLGEALRVTSVVRRAGVPVAAATASTVTLRAADVAALGLVAAVLGPQVLLDVAGAGAIAVGVLAIGAVGAGMVWLRSLIAAGDRDLRLPGLRVGALTLVAWLLEAVVIWGAARWAGAPITPTEAVLVTAITIAAQVLAVAPGGFGTYEVAATAALVAVGVPAGTGLAIALAAHALKTAYALATGVAAVLLPGPGMFGRLRLTPRAARFRGSASAEASPDAPLLLFMPAHDEEACIADVIARVPDEVLGRRVEFLVIDDGSTDATATVARDAGVEVRSLGRNRGLGAAVRIGLGEGARRGAVAVVFCDADGEYAPEELDRMVAPILAGEADYVIGSRFAGDIHRMLPHRRLGNRVLTVLLRFVARTPITDGQSGYRALSANAARDAEIAHDFNYAQVLTLDLLAKGYRYAEVPISYRFRETGRSFVRLPRYLRHIVPAVYRVVNTPETA